MWGEPGELLSEEEVWQAWLRQQDAKAQEEAQKAKGRRQDQDHKKP